MKVLSLNRVENFTAKGGIAHREQLMLLSKCFQRSSAADASNGTRKRVYVGKG